MHRTPGGTATTTSTTPLRHQSQHSQPNSLTALLGVAVVAALSLYAVTFLWSVVPPTVSSIPATDGLPTPLPWRPRVTSQIVFWSAWITAAATGLGVIPFLFTSKFDAKWVAFGNAVAAGMMLSASMGLVEEGLNESNAGPLPASRASTPRTPSSSGAVGSLVSPDSLEPTLAPAIRVAVGFVLGGMFIWQSKVRLDADPTESFHAMHLGGRDAKKALLIMCVMTLHSLTEGIGIGVSYHSPSLGSFISATLAVHNIPEGLAIAVVLLPRGVSKAETCLWCVFSSLPQPIMAVPAFLFVEAFLPVFSLGLGFAAGAMLWVAVFELLPDASEVFSPPTTLGIASVSATVLALVQVFLRDDMA